MKDGYPVEDFLKSKDPEVNPDMSKLLSFEISFKEKYDSFMVTLQDHKGTPDCHIGHIGYNFWFRLKRFIDPPFVQYKTFKGLLQAIKDEAQTYGLTALTFGDLYYDS